MKPFRGKAQRPQRLTRKTSIQAAGKYIRRAFRERSKELPDRCDEEVNRGEVEVDRVMELAKRLGLCILDEE
ncbi:MAG TPA: hypothetical protein VNO70_15105 [Blastocatellia bacterium]|nr:hypothetical protein [Blastocatellia bacterium]